MHNLKHIVSHHLSTRGFALAVILFLIPLFFVLALAFMSLTEADYTFSSHMARKIRAHYLAESGNTYAYNKRAQWNIPTPDDAPEKIELTRNGVSLGKVKMWVRRRTFTQNNSSIKVIEITSQGMDPSGVYTKITTLMNSDGEIISWNEEETQKLKAYQRYSDWWNYNAGP